MKGSEINGLTGQTDGSAFILRRVERKFMVQID